MDCTLQEEGNSIEELDCKMTSELAMAEEWFTVNKLTLNIKKTKFAVFSNDISRLKSIPDLTINGLKIDRIGINQDEKTVKFLGINIDDSCNFISHVDKIKSNLSRGLYQLAISKENTPMRVRLNMYRALFESHLRFGNIIFGSTPDFKIDELLILQKTAVRYILNTYYRAHTDPLFSFLKLLKVRDLILSARATFVHQYRSGHLPSSFHRKYFECIKPENCGRREDPLCMIVPPTTSKILERSPYVLLCRDWNSLPFSIRSIAKLSEFKKELTNHLLNKYDKVCSKTNCRACIFGAIDFSS